MRAPPICNKQAAPPPKFEQDGRQVGARSEAGLFRPGLLDCVQRVRLGVPHPGLLGLGRTERPSTASASVPLDRIRPEWLAENWR